MGKMSAGIHSTVNRKLLKAVRRSRSLAETRLNQVKAWKKANGGKNDPWITIENPNAAETNKRMIRVRATMLWGSAKYKRKTDTED